ncbi:hypothetical protein EO244_11615 [Ancylomarina salipaludis]|uniref:BIG2 domain-containing protein n=1 Tax=Ancylomarina salipaludis TaxID=2501299 RepID=A0A4Q1JL13_9BACT|nr:hypothetical protein [Ancylomarina salipaludis]RXQ92190.1 hypothetical protein EO244_11615 [Ancylomarina salipaludis]
MKNRFIKLKALLICSLMLVSLFSCTNKEDENIIRTVVVTETFKTIKAGESFEISLTKESAAQNLSYRSYNLEVATVDDKGVVTGLNAGFAIIGIENESGAEATIELTVEKADFIVPAEIVGQWTGVKIELINKVSGDIYDEETILSMLNSELTDAEKESWFNSVRTQYSYTMNDDNSIVMTLSMDDGSNKDVYGELSEDEKYKNTYHATFDVAASGISGIEVLMNQPIVYNGEYVAIETSFGPDFDLVTYYNIERE